MCTTNLQYPAIRLNCKLYKDDTHSKQPGFLRAKHQIYKPLNVLTMGMKPIYVVLFLLVLLLVACVNKYGSGKIISEERKVDNFTKIDVGGDIKVDITQGTEFSVLVEADDNVLPYIKTEVNGETLEINLVHNYNVSNAHIEVKIVMPKVQGIDASASAEIYAENVLDAAGDIHLSTSSSASIVAAVNAAKISLESSSAGKITVSGKCKELKTDASSGSEITALKLLSENGNADASSGAEINIFCSVYLNAEASSGGSIVYSGNPKLDVNMNSGGSVKRLN